MVTIEIPRLPISANKAFATFRGRRIITREYHQFCAVVERLVPDCPPWGPFSQLHVDVDLYSEAWFTKKGVRKRDIDNFVKPLLDSIFKHWVLDDSNIFTLNVRKCVGVEKTVVRIGSHEVH
jgi:Holliday junction resolvase RusA-like endonuclease